MALTAWRDVRRQPLPVSPVSAVSSVVITDVNGTDFPVAAHRWYLEPDLQRPSLQPASGSLPTLPQGASVTLGMLAGFGPEWDDLPADLAQAVLMLAAHFYEFRFDAARKAPALPAGVQSLIEPYRTVRIFGGGRV